MGWIKEVTTVQTISDIISENSMARMMFSEVHQLLQLYLTVPMPTATAERTFSMLQRLKKCRMTQERLNQVMLLHTNKDKTDELNLYDIAKELISFNDRRRHFLV